MRRTKAPTGATIGLVGRDGARSFLHCLGASGEIFIQPDELRAEAAGFTHYHLGAPFRLTRMRPVMPGLLRAARDAGLSTSLDTQWDADGRWMEDIGPCLPHTDVFFANEDEFRMLTGSTDPAAAARCLRAAGASTVVLKLGGRGCAVYNDAGETRCPAYDVPVLDTTGAGDCFAGGFLHAWARRAEVMEAARFASAVAALCVQSLGATEGVRSLEETLTWMQAARPLPAQ